MSGSHGDASPTGRSLPRCAEECELRLPSRRHSHGTRNAESEYPAPTSAAHPNDEDCREVPRSENCGSHRGCDAGRSDPEGPAAADSAATSTFRLGRSSSSPSRPLSRAVNRPPVFAMAPASTVRYSCGSKASISASRVQTIPSDRGRALTHVYPSDKSRRGARGPRPGTPDQAALCRKSTVFYPKEDLSVVPPEGYTFTVAVFPRTP